MQRLLLLTCFLQATNLYCAFWTTRNIDIQDRLEAEPSINAMSGLGMRTRSVITGSFTWNATPQHFPTLPSSRMRRFRCGAKQTTGNSPWHRPAHIRISEIRHVGCVPIWALNPAFAVKYPHSSPASNPNDQKQNAGG